MMPILRKQLPTYPHSINEIIRKAISEAFDTLVVQKVYIKIHIMAYYNTIAYKADQLRKCI